MSRGAFHLFMMAFWGLIGSAMLLRYRLADHFQFEFRDSSNFDLCGYIALALALFNFSRWYLGRSLRKSLELERAARAEREARLAKADGGKAVTDPRFDFRNAGGDPDGEAK